MQQLHSSGSTKLPETFMRTGETNFFEDTFNIFERKKRFNFKYCPPFSAWGWVWTNPRYVLHNIHYFFILFFSCYSTFMYLKKLSAHVLVFSFSYSVVLLMVWPTIFLCLVWLWCGHFWWRVIYCSDRSQQHLKYQSSAEWDLSRQVWFKNDMEHEQVFIFSLIFSPLATFFC